MLRIPCSCGKDLKVTESLLGRKIKCPACGAVQVARDPSLPVLATGSRTSPDAHEEFAAPPAGKKDKGSPDAAPGKKKPAKKGGLLKWVVILLLAVLILGGGAVAGLYFGMGIKAWELVTGTPAKTKGAPKKSGARNPVSDEDAVAIKLFVPHKVGEKRQLAMVANLKVDVKAEGPDVNDEMKAAMANENFDEELKLVALIETAEVNDKGEETKIKLTVKQMKFDVFGGKKAGKKESPLAPGTILTGTLAGDKWAWSGPTEVPATISAKLSDYLTASFFNEPESAADEMFGTTEKRADGDTWPINKDAVTKHLTEHGLREKAAKKGVIVASGTGRVAEIDTAAKKPYLEIELNLNVTETGDSEQFVMKKSVTMRFPKDGSTGAYKKADAVEVKMILKPNPNTTVTSTGVGTITSETTYLSDAAGEKEEPPAKGKDKGKTPGKDKGKSSRLISMSSYPRVSEVLQVSTDKSTQNSTKKTG